MPKAYHQPLGDAIVQSYPHGSIIQSKEVLSALVQRSETV